MDKAWRTGNLFFDHMPDQARDFLRPQLIRISMKSGEVIFDLDDIIEKVVFPLSSVISIVLPMSDGSVSEVGIIGREGMTGTSIVLGQSRSEQRAIVQIPNGAFCLEVEQFRTAIETYPELKAWCLRYTQATFVANARLAACNNLHPINARCARWLLMSHDRVGKDTLPLTQEFLSQMLGVRRSSVTLAASALQSAGFIEYSRGRVIVTNRLGLESATCECYESMESQWLKSMTYSSRETRHGGT